MRGGKINIYNLQHAKKKKEKKKRYWIIDLITN
jgi:hypothetical protein